MPSLLAVPLLITISRWLRWLCRHVHLWTRRPCSLHHLCSCILFNVHARACRVPGRSAILESVLTTVRRCIQNLIFVLLLHVVVVITTHVLSRSRLSYILLICGDVVARPTHVKAIAYTSTLISISMTASLAAPTTIVVQNART